MHQFNGINNSLKHYQKYRRETRQTLHQIQGELLDVVQGIGDSPMDLDCPDSSCCRVKTEQQERERLLRGSRGLKPKTSPGAKNGRRARGNVLIVGRYKARIAVVSNSRV